MDNAEQEAKESRQQGNGALALHDPEHEERIAWWREARLGMFIHWGLYSLPGGIWRGEEVKAAYAEHLQLKAQIPIKEYETIAAEFNPVKFDADEWARAAKDAGMKYLVVTTKHHDGFAMYDSKVSDYNIVKATPYGRDPMAELAEACHKHGVKLCFYYSHSMDWHHPDSQGNTLDFPANIGAYDPVESWIDDEDKASRYERYLQQKAFPQIKELLTQYGPVGVIWFDCGHKLTREQGERFMEVVRSEQPDCLVNRRVWKDPLGDYGNTMDNQPHVRVSRPDWESIATLNDSWGYKKLDNNWKTPLEIIHNLIDVVSMNGNFLINVGPTGEGDFDPMSLQLLREIGGWLRVNGDSIYGTVQSPIGKPPWGRCTLKGNKLYLHVFDWPASGKLLVPGIRNGIVRASLLADPEGSALEVTRLNSDDLLIRVPSEAPDELVSVVALELSGPVSANPVKRLYTSEYDNVFSAFDGEIHGTMLRYDTGKKDRDVVTAWSEVNDWLEWTFRVAEPACCKVEITYGVEPGDEGGAFTVSTSLKAGSEASGASGISGADVEGALDSSDSARLSAKADTIHGKDAAFLSAEVQETGGGYEYRTFDIGEIRLEQAGIYTLAVQAEHITGQSLMNLKQVVLVRADA
ncbi:hypothetical protein J2TS4_24630 [Paenibacillus sp. J2TS4]|nr:hypothetical protein J2TS4_24630 [Paenibacillus sp. J2TS4]